MIAVSSPNCIAYTGHLPVIRRELSSRGSGHDCQVEAFIHRLPKILFAAQVSLGGLHGCMTDQKFQLATT
jgi:hypothetical protein